MICNTSITSQLWTKKDKLLIHRGKRDGCSLSKEPRRPQRIVNMWESTCKMICVTRITRFALLPLIVWLRGLIKYPFITVHVTLCTLYSYKYNELIDYELQVFEWKQHKSNNNWTGAKRFIYLFVQLLERYLNWMYFSNYLITIPCQKVFRQFLKILKESNRDLSYFGTNPPRFIAQRQISGPNSPLLQIRFGTPRVQE